MSIKTYYVYTGEDTGKRRDGTYWFRKGDRFEHDSSDLLRDGCAPIDGKRLLVRPLADLGSTYCLLVSELELYYPYPKDAPRVTKDSGEHELYASGMVRDTEEGKARFDLLIPDDVPYAEQMLTRFAELLARGAEKYSARNWELARGEVELARYKSSALRHLMQWVSGETDEDHAAAVMFNLLAAETVKYKMKGD